VAETPLAAASVASATTRERAPARTAAVLAIGNELLSGKVVDQNLAHAIRELRALGVSLTFAAMIPDDATAIADALHYALARAEVVVTTGGVGFTHDDLTVSSIARALGRRLVREPELEAAIRKWYGRHATDDVLRMADVPEGAELIRDPDFFLPLLKVDRVHVFPGVPTHFRRQFDFWKRTLAQDPFALAQVYLDADESELSHDLRAVEAAAGERGAGVAIGSYPKDAEEARRLGYRVLVTIESKNKAAVRAATRDLIARLRPGKLVRCEEPRDPEETRGF
jgi:molybdenum cofactor synthesis domain-containing protein